MGRCAASFVPTGAANDILLQSVFSIHIEVLAHVICKVLCVFSVV